MAESKGGKPAEAHLSPRERFVNSAQTRVNAVLEGLTRIAKLNSSAYEYTEADVEKITEALLEKVEHTKAVLLKEATATVGFSLDD